MRHAVGAAAALLLAMLFFVAPAGATITTARIDAPAGGSLGGGVVTVGGTFTVDDGTRRVTSIFKSRRNTTYTQQVAQDVGGSGGFSMTSPGLAWNGTYDLATEFVNVDPDRGIFDSGCTCKSLDNRTVDVLVAPTVPAGVAGTFDAESRSIHLTWEANGEPDLIGYLVQRKIGNGQVQDRAEIFVPEPTDIVDGDLPSTAAQVTYFVTAYRRGVQDSDAVASTGAGQSTAVAVPKAPATTTTSGPGGVTTTKPSTTPTSRKGFGTPVVAPPASTTTRPTLRPGGQSAGAFGGGLNGPNDRSGPPVTADTFDGTLPFNQRNDYDPDEELELTDEGGDPASVSRSEENQTQALAFVGAALNVAVWAALGLWLRAQVRREDDEVVPGLLTSVDQEDELEFELELEDEVLVAPKAPIDTARVRVRRRPVATAMSEPKPEPEVARPVLKVRRDRPLRARQA